MPVCATRGHALFRTRVYAWWGEDVGIDILHDTLRCKVQELEGKHGKDTKTKNMSTT